MSQHNYSPAKIFKLIHSDADVEHYIQLYKHRRLSCQYGAWISLLILIGMIVVGSSNDTLSLSPAILAKIPYGLLWFASVFSFCAFYLIGASFTEMLDALTPISGTHHCVNIKRMIADYEEARKLRDTALQQGRQLYHFDADYMEEITDNLQSDTEKAAIENACKDIYNIERGV